MTIWQRIALAVLIVLVIMFALAMCSHFGGLRDEAQAQEVRLYEGLALDATLLQLDKRALNEAYHLRLIRLFDVWLSAQAPAEAVQLQNGLRIARRAYNQAAQQIAKREQELLELDRQQQRQNLDQSK